MIDWAKVQRALTRAGYPCGNADGEPGPLTFGAIFACAAGRQADATIATLGRAGSSWLVGDAITQTPQRLAEFAAQTAHETGGYTTWREGFGYSAAQLVTQWPSHFTALTAAKCVGKPIEIAGRCYGGRMGNAAWPSQDGWTYRGRGCIQLTGRAAYAAMGPVVGLDLLANPDLAADPADSLVIAREFWRQRGVNAAVDRGDYTAARKLTNGGTIGLADVAARRARLLAVLT